jgi:hypothetical protein
MARVANLNVTQRGGNKVLTVSVPSKPTGKELTLLGQSISDMVKTITGCPCLSGVMSVVLDEEMGKVVTVDLAKAAG